MKVGRSFTSLSALVVLVGCNSLSHAPAADDFQATPGFPQGPGGPTSTLIPSFGVDSRPAVIAAKRPPPITGGTLLITPDGLTAVAADPDRDRVSIVSLSNQVVTTTVQLEIGDEPGRVIEDGSGHALVALRRGGAVVTIDIASGAILARRAVCGAPRGLAWDAATNHVIVACSGGELVTLDGPTGDAIRRVRLDTDLRDVIVRSDGVYVSRFKSAELLRVDATGNVASRVKLHGLTRASDTFDPSGIPGTKDEPIEPAVAWRALSSPDGSVVMLHQYELAAKIHLPKTDPGDPSPPGPVPGFPEQSQSAYGAPMGGCGGLVQGGVTRVDPDGTVHMGSPLSAPVLGVDAAISLDGRWVAIAHAGTVDPDSPAGAVASSGIPVTLVDEESDFTFNETSAPCMAPGQISFNGQAIAVAFNPSVEGSTATQSWIVAQTREPAQIVLIRDPLGTHNVAISLGGDSVFDTGHDLFHRDAGSGIACASCHSEGAEDGRVWDFDPTGPRRTQAVDVGLEGTAPFHWDGDMTDFTKLMNEVLVRRMGGPQQTDDRKLALETWLYSLSPPAPIVSNVDPSAVRGMALFTSADVGCTNCHKGSTLTNNLNANVGTTDASLLLQVPSLHGVGYRAPFLHDGRAATLAERFDPAIGGGDAHGHTSQLTPVQIGDLIAYLESL